MSSSLSSWSSGEAARAPSEDWTNGLLVASDGREASDAALVAAHALAGRRSLRVLAVIPTNASNERCEPRGTLPTSPELHRALIEAQIRRLLGEESRARVYVRSGYPPAVVAAFAELHRASMIVAGIGRSRVLDRLMGDESILRLARMARTPLLAVARAHSIQPRRIVVGIDFSETSLHAARMALRLADSRAEITLAYVGSPGTRAPSHGALRRQADQLQTGFIGLVTPVTLAGDAATELLAIAETRRADLLVVGRRGSAPREQGALGVVATRVVRCAPCSVLLSCPELELPPRWAADRDDEHWAPE